MTAIYHNINNHSNDDSNTHSIRSYTIVYMYVVCHVHYLIVQDTNYDLQLRPSGQVHGRVHQLRSSAMPLRAKPYSAEPVCGPGPGPANRAGNRAG